MENFTPGTALLGGILIGLSASALLLFDGRIAGISGIFAGAIRPAKGETAWRLCFLAGLLAGGGLLRIFLPGAFEFGHLRPSVVFALGGLLVGFGTRMAGGCTSGHGVCGMARLSMRSVVATATFIAMGALTVYVTRHLLGLQ
jgi:uncharacterized protein